MRFLIMAFILCIPTYATPKVYDMNIEESVFALITHKKGLFSSMAHNHFITANPSESKAEKAEDGSWTLAFTFPVEGLKVDPYAIASAHYPQIESMALLEEAFAELEDKDRKKIRKSMLEKGQLDAKNHAQITANLVSVAAAEQTIGSVTFSHVMNVDMTIKGKTQQVSFAANIEESEDGKTRIQALGKSKFSDFGIEPYSAFFGAVANQDTIEFYLVLELTPQAG